MRATLFPQRQRCQKCAKSLGAGGAPVYKGLFCTPACAGMAQLFTDATRAPRECTTVRAGATVFKVRYRSSGEIPDRLRSDPSTNWYICNHCGHQHIGHSRITDREALRVMHRPSDIADVLVKMRGEATRAQVAGVAKIRPIRLKELEEGTAIAVTHLMAVVEAMGGHLAVVLRESGAS